MLRTTLLVGKLDATGRLAWVDAPFLDTLGYGPEDLLGRPLENFLSSDSARRWREEHLPGLARDGIVWDVPLQVVTPRGKLLDVLVHASRSGEGDSLWSHLVILDVSELQRAQTALQQSEARFYKIFEHSNDAVFLIDPEHDRILDFNSRACAMLAYTREELRVKAISDIHPRELPALLAFARSVFDRGSGWTNELTCLTKSGELLPSEISASAVVMEGRPCIIAIVRDISERKRAERALREYADRLSEMVEARTAELRASEKRHRVLLEINNAVILHRERDGLFQAIAQALRLILDYDRIALMVYDREQGACRLAAAQGIEVAEAPVGATLGADTPVGWTFAHARVFRRDDLDIEHPTRLEKTLWAAGLRSFVLLPLRTPSGVIGVMGVSHKQPRRYSDADVDFLQDVGLQFGMAIQNMLAYEEIARLKALLEKDNLSLQEEVRTQHRFEEIVGQSQAIRKVLQAIETVAPTNATVLILGETGTGKELVARALHALSAHRARALVTVNCAALPAGLIESEFFGHEKGAFTGATSRKIGRFELADGGTIFMDEIGDLPLDLQAKLLRVLQDGEFQRVGGSQTLRVHVRVISATNRDLEEALRAGSFRQDLYYRLNVFPIRIPALRERLEDVPLLVKHFALKHGTRLGKKIETISQSRIELLQSYSWPGNARELENVIERAVILSRGPELELSDWLPRAESTPRHLRVPTIAELEREHILKVLRMTGGRLSGERGAAHLLGLQRSTLQGRMRKLGIHRPHPPAE